MMIFVAGILLILSAAQIARTYRDTALFIWLKRWRGVLTVFSATLLVYIQSGMMGWTTLLMPGFLVLTSGIGMVIYDHHQRSMRKQED
ncbi:hypothetical protein PY95_13360 [Lacticaseibacillus rhamnosus]|uniref:hypothetical protein n=1 Tax=Lacticaseibacillus rhamnosus TaxID=47715 RepID=UPI00065AA150|nr:hypothetical protein [Lacticaseibacillus rhamnosus]KMO45361.1 hypothetical protein PY95_13360 [Lacticaseibacillus rhamnosus]OAT96024.1 hypothetical protein PY72_13360 [Lacticaseibacillus rhamnosus]